MKFSIVIPVYNSERYLQKCVESVLEQNYSNFEIILINDGSTDSSQIICDQLSKADERIRVFKTTNKGTAYARNLGILESKGDYIMFLDSDDYWNNKEALKYINEILVEKKVDVLIYKYHKFFFEGENANKKNDKFKEIIFDKSSNLNYLIDNHIFFASACDKVVSRSFFKTQELFFDLNNSCEDISWSFKVLLRFERICFIDLDFYCYRQHSYSKSHNVSINHVRDLITSIEQCLELLKEVNCDNLNEYVYLNYIAYQYATLFANIGLLNSSDKNKISEYVKKYKWLLKYGQNRKVKLLYFTDNFFGYKIMCRLAFLYFKYFRKR